MLPQQSNFSNPCSGLIPADPLGQCFTAIFNHCWHFIYRDVADSGWQTETAYPIEPRNLWAMWRDATTLIGVRFGKATCYAMLDIDAESPYHPANDPAALEKIRAALETIGVYRTLLVRSSDSGGLHLYCPLPSALPTYGIALALKHCLSNAGFHLAPGALESFPNCKSWIKGGVTDYQAHRLPLQAGSYLLNQDGEILSADLDHFLSAWETAAAGNPTDELTEAIALAIAANKKSYQPSESRCYRKWKEDCERVIESGWTAPGQTNELLLVIARYGIVFCSLAKEALVQYVLTTAINAPGYLEFCNHQHEIERRSRDWAKECEKYYRPHPSYPGLGNPWKGEKAKTDRRRERNLQTTANAIERIKCAAAAVAQKLTTIRELAASIAAAAKCSLKTLYKHLNLWHPEHTEGNSHTDPSESDSGGDPPPSDLPPESLKSSSDGLLHPSPYKKVLNAVTLLSIFKKPFTLGNTANRNPRRLRFSEQNRPIALPDSASPSNRFDAVEDDSG